MRMFLGNLRLILYPPFLVSEIPKFLSAGDERLESIVLTSLPKKYKLQDDHEPGGEEHRRFTHKVPAILFDDLTAAQQPLDSFFQYITGVVVLQNLIECKAVWSNEQIAYKANAPRRKAQVDKMKIAIAQRTVNQKVGNGNRQRVHWGLGVNSM